MSKQGGSLSCKILYILLFLVVPSEFFLNGAIWCILKCILIKFQGENSLKIYVFIATTTKKTTSLLGADGGMLYWENFEEIVQSSPNPRDIFEKIVQFSAF